MYVIEGPTEIGNRFGYSGHALAAGKFAIVEDGEYSDGGYGPSSVDGNRYASRAAAEDALRQLQTDNDE